MLYGYKGSSGLFFFSLCILAMYIQISSGWLIFSLDAFSFAVFAPACMHVRVSMFRPILSRGFCSDSFVSLIVRFFKSSKSIWLDVDTFWRIADRGLFQLLFNNFAR